MYKRVLLKLSGEALSDEKEIFSSSKLIEVAKQIKIAHENGTQICIVIGGGNIYRGKLGVDLGTKRSTGDAMGMLATVMNSLAMHNALDLVGVDSVVLTSIAMMPIAKQFTRDEALKSLEEGKVVIFGGGTGNPYFSTDTCSALRALETDCEVILMAKNGVDGIYDSDPRTNPNAKRYEKISYLEIISKKLKVMDLSAVALCMDNNMPLFVFNMNNVSNIVKAINNDVIGTIVK